MLTRFLTTNINIKETKLNLIKAVPVLVNVLDYILEVSEFKLQSSYYVHFWTNTHIILPTIGKKSPRLFYKDVFGIKLPTKVDMPLTKKTNLSIHYKN